MQILKLRKARGRSKKLIQVYEAILVPRQTSPIRVSKGSKQTFAKMFSLANK